MPAAGRKMMFRAEIVANQSVKEDIIELLEQTIPDILYTVIPTVHGRGKNNRKLGTTTWPEQNFLLFAYVEKPEVPLIRAVIAAVKNKFPDEGIKLFTMESD
jgi:hypothetical protein